MINSIIDLLSKAFGFLNSRPKTPDKEIAEREDEETDVRVVDLNSKELRHKRNYVLRYYNDLYPPLKRRKIKQLIREQGLDNLYEEMVAKAGK